MHANAVGLNAPVLAPALAVAPIVAGNAAAQAAAGGIATDAQATVDKGAASLIGADGKIRLGWGLVDAPPVKPTDPGKLIAMRAFGDVAAPEAKPDLAGAKPADAALGILPYREEDLGKLNLDQLRDVVTDVKTRIQFAEEGLKNAKTDAEKGSWADLLKGLNRYLKMVIELIEFWLTGKAPDLFKKEEDQGIKGTEPGGWLVKHGQYQKQPDGSYKITGGKYAGNTAVPDGKGSYSILASGGTYVGTFDPPGGAQKIASPLVFDLNGDGKAGTTSIAGGKVFDLDGDGKLDRTAWAGPGDGVLAFDRDGDGVAGSDGTELFGNNTIVDGNKFENGFEALKALATKHLGPAAAADGQLDAAELAALGEKAGLTMLVDGKRVGLAELGITKIGLGYAEAGPNADAHGNEHRQVGEGFEIGGQRRAVDDVWFRYEAGAGER
ncbi:MAG: hypothetical protein FJZ01_10165 [Candidatus Sericytochromatia bacterium]|nr:hypothetical protein [Candidatus Tanganyikabacteria bacterium]